MQFAGEQLELILRRQDVPSFWCEKMNAGNFIESAPSLDTPMKP